MKVRIAPSVAAGDLSDLGGAVRIAEAGGADQLHLDVADGHFAPNITFGPGTVKALRPLSELIFDTHLMIDEPLLYAEKFLDAGSDLISCHAEVLTAEKFDTLRALTKKKGAKLGLALKPETPMPGWAEERLAEIDTLLVMTVHPGFSGQSLLRAVLPKLRALSSEVRKKGLDTDLEVDGGVEPDNAGELAALGANVLVAGASAYRRGDVAKAIGQLKARAGEAVVAK